MKRHAVLLSFTVAFHLTVAIDAQTYSTSFGLIDPAHVAPGVTEAVHSLTGGAQVRLVWVQKQFISDDSSRYLVCNDSVTNRWLYGGGPGTQLVGFDSKEGTGRIFDSSISTHIKPVIDRSGGFVFWSEIANSRSWVMNWQCTIRKPFITGGDYVVLCTQYDKTTAKEYVYTGELNGYDEYLLAVKNIHRYELDLLSGSAIVATKTLVWNKSYVHLPFNVASDGVHAAGNMPWPSANIATLPNGDRTFVQRGTGSDVNSWSCHVNIAPDASLRVFRMEETHTQMVVYPPTYVNPTWIPLIKRLPGAAADWDCNAPRWTNDLRYLTIFAPYTYWLKGTTKVHDCTRPVAAAPWQEGESGEIYFGKLNESFTDAQFVRITDGDWRFRKVQGEGWVATGEGPASTLVDKGVKFREAAGLRAGGSGRACGRLEMVALDGRTA